MKQVKYCTALTIEDRIDVTLYLEKNRVLRFALNYRARIKGKWVEVYRVDNFHGYLHEQKFWIGREPIRLETYLPLEVFVKQSMDRIIEEFRNYRKCMETRKQWT